MPGKRPAPPFSESRKIHPKLRMIMNGDTKVNVMRSESSAALAARDKAVLEGIPRLLTAKAEPVRKSRRAVKAPPDLKHISADMLANVFVELNEIPDASHPVPGETARIGNVATAQLPLSEISDLASRTAVSFVSIGDVLTVPTPQVTLKSMPAPTRPAGVTRMEKKHRNGRGVLIGIIDVEGFDFTHSEFLDREGKTRFVRIWDQGGSARPSPVHGDIASYDYGAEFTADHINAALGAAKTSGVSALDLEPQSQMFDQSHGTHVAGIAAGNSGICSEAMIAGVLMDIPREYLEGRLSFYDSTRLAQAVDYLFRLGSYLDAPVSINISLGTNGHAHDASSGVSRWIDLALAVAGRSVCVAAGNAGQEAPTTEDDFGYVMGRIHTSGRIAARGLDYDIFWTVVGNGIADVSENEFEIWYEPQDRFAVSLRPPNQNWIGPVEPGEFIENRRLEDLTVISVFNELYHPANGCNYMSIYLSPYYTEQFPDPLGIAPGVWTVRLHGREIRDGSFHGWIERDDPRPHKMPSKWNFPSFFTEHSNVDNSSVSSLACGRRIVSVANLNQAAEAINITSSQGPTRDGRKKPEVAAPGTNIVAARGFGPAGEEWISMSGTSMASPFVAGVVGLMLSVNRLLTSAQICGIIRRTARPLPGNDFSWADDAGFGAIDVEGCIREAEIASNRTEVRG